MLIKRWRPLQRAVLAVDGDDRIADAEYAADQMQPDCERAVEAARTAASRSQPPAAQVSDRSQMVCSLLVLPGRVVRSMDFRPVCVRGPIDETAAQVAEAIWEGTLPAGARLPAERTLADQLGISRPTLRLALRRLADRGLLAITRGRGGGAVVRSETVPLELLWSGPTLDVDEIGAVLEARRSLEPQVARLAARNATGEDFEKLRRLVQRQREAHRDHTLQHQLDVRFHLAIARATHNSSIWSIARELQLRVAVARLAMRRTPVDPRAVAEIHEGTLAAILRGDPAGIDRHMHEHLACLERRWERERSGSALA